MCYRRNKRKKAGSGYAVAELNVFLLHKNKAVATCREPEI